MIERKIPRLMMPSGKKHVASVASSKETAFVNAVEGQCPVCKTQMKLSVANGVDVYVCVNDRVAMPIRNEGQ